MPKTIKSFRFTDALLAMIDKAKHLAHIPTRTKFIESACRLYTLKILSDIRKSDDEKTIKS